MSNVTCFPHVIRKHPYMPPCLSVEIVVHLVFVHLTIFVIMLPNKIMCCLAVYLWFINDFWKCLLALLGANKEQIEKRKFVDCKHTTSTSCTGCNKHFKTLPKTSHSREHVLKSPSLSSGKPKTFMGLFKTKAFLRVDLFCNR